MSTVECAAADVVIACHDERRWDALVEALASAKAQIPPPAGIVVVVDHSPALLARLQAFDPSLIVVENRYERGASGARNTGAALATRPVVAFLDDDAVAHPGWLAGLLGPLDEPMVVGTGGSVIPAWHSGRPSWFPDEFAWVIGASHTGQPSEIGPIRNVWSENMAVKRDVFESVGGFRVGFGKVGERSRPEDTDLCIRMRSIHPHSEFMYVPHAIVDHKVPVERSTFRFFLRRCYHEGRGKVELSHHLGVDHDLGMERDWLRRTVPKGIWNNISAAIRRGQRAGGPRAAAMLAGLAAAAVGGALSGGLLVLTRRRNTSRKGVPELAVTPPR